MKTQYSTHKIASFEVVDHGIEHAQYFQGCGVAYTDFDSIATGAGENALEAFDDALEQIALSESVDLSTIEASSEYKTANTKRCQRFTVEAFHRRNGNIKRGQDYSDAGFENEHYYYLSIRYSLAASDDVVLMSAGLHASQK